MMNRIADLLTVLITFINFGQNALIAFIECAQSAMQSIKNPLAIVITLLIVASTLIAVVGIIAFSVIIVLGPRSQHISFIITFCIRG